MAYNKVSFFSGLVIGLLIMFFIIPFIQPTDKEIKENIVISQEKEESISLVIEEKEELDGRITRLKEFLSGDMMPSLPHDEQIRLRRQVNIMVSYSDVLVERIQAFALMAE